MKILLYTEGLKVISKSGLGKAIKHQMKALEDNKTKYTTDLKEDYDLLHINFFGPKSYFFAKKAKKNGKKIIYHAHSTEEDFRNSFILSNLMAPLFKRWLIKCYKLGDQIITPTEYSKRLLEGYNMDRPIKAISNGVETKFFERDEDAGKEFRKKYGYKKSDKIIVGIGLYIKRKGIIDFVELARRLPQYKFIWFGYSPLWASPREIKKAVNTELPNLHFAGYVDSSVIKSALSGSNLYLFPTLEETEGIPIIEALTSKIPTLIRDIPVFEEYEADKVVYKSKDIDDFESKIKLIVENKLPNLTEKGYKAAKKKDLKTVGKELIKTYKETLNPEVKKASKKNKTKKEIVEEIKQPAGINKTLRLRNIALILSAILFAIAIFFAADGLKKEELNEYKKTFSYLGSNIEVVLYTTSDKKAEEAFTAMEEIYKNFEKLTDRRDISGALYYLSNNVSDDEYVAVDPKLYEIIKYGIELYGKSDGLVNINMGNINDIWAKYREEQNGIPSNSQLRNAGSIDINDIVLASDNRIQNTNVNIDLDLIVRGYATEKASEYLEENKITIYRISTRGIVIFGEHSEKDSQYRLIINSPFKNDDENVLASIMGTNMAVSSKGIYQNHYEFKGKDYGYFINPKTKFPAEFMVGVTVIADDATTAEFLSTALFLMPIAQGQEFIKNYDADAIWAFIDIDGTHRKVSTENFYNGR